MTVPAVADAKVEFGVPRVGVTPLIVALDSVAKLEAGGFGASSLHVAVPPIVA